MQRRVNYVIPRLETTIPLERLRTVVDRDGWELAIADGEITFHAMGFNFVIPADTTPIPTEWVRTAVFNEQALTVSRAGQIFVLVFDDALGEQNIRPEVVG